MGLERGLRKARVLVAFVANWGLIPNTHIKTSDSSKPPVTLAPWDWGSTPFSGHRYYMVTL